MACYLLAGPIAVDVPGYVGVNPPVVIPKFWWPTLGLVCQFGNYEGVLALDGVWFSWRSTAFGSFYGWWVSRARAVTLFDTPSGQEEIVYEPEAWAGQGAAPSGTFTSGVANRYIKFDDRWLFCSGNNIVSRKDGVTTVEKALPWSGGGAAFIGRSHEEVLISSTSGSDGPQKCRFYNSGTRDWSSNIFYVGPPTKFIFCAQEHGLLLTLHPPVMAGSPQTLRIWSMEVQPTQISAPAQVTSEEIIAGKVTDFRTRVLGSDNDPAENEVVEWSVSGAGTLLKNQSLTDVNGWAYARVRYGIGEAGATSTLEALLKC